MPSPAGKERATVPLHFKPFTEGDKKSNRLKLMPRGSHADIAANPTTDPEVTH